MSDFTQIQPNTWHLIRRAIIYSALGILALSTFINLSLLAVPLYSLQIFDRVLHSQSEETLWMLCSVTLIFCFMGVALDMVRRRIPRILCQLINDRLLPINIEDWASNAVHRGKKSSTPNLSKSQSDPGVFLKLSYLLAQPSLQGVADALFIPLFLFLMFLMHPLLGITMLSINMLLVSVTIIRHYSLKQIEPQLQQAADNTQRECATLQQEYANAYTMGYHHLWQARVARSLEQQTQHIGQSNNTQQSLLSAANGLRTLSQVAIPTVGAILLIQQQISAGQLLASIIIASRCLLPFDQLIAHWRDLFQLHGILQTVKALLSRTQDEKYHPTTTLNGTLRLVSHANAQTRPIDIRMARGERIAIIGPAGSGKSSLLQSMMGISPPQLSANANSSEPDNSLKIYLDDYQSHHLDRRWLHNQIGYASVSSAPVSLQVKDYISHLQTSTSNRIERAAKQAGIHHDIIKLSAGYDTLITQDPKSCGRGFMQKLAIARALFFQPRYLFLDEVDNHLDNQGLEKLQLLLLELQVRGTTVVLATQRKSIIESCDKILLMDNGIPAFYGKPQGLSMSGNQVHQLHSAASSRGETP